MASLDDGNIGDCPWYLAFYFCRNDHLICSFACSFSLLVCKPEVHTHSFSYLGCNKAFHLRVWVLQRTHVSWLDNRLLWRRKWPQWKLSDCPAHTYCRLLFLIEFSFLNLFFYIIFIVFFHDHLSPLSPLPLPPIPLLPIADLTLLGRLIYVH